MPGLDEIDYYKLLGIDRKATVPQIKDAFRKFALQHHPDRKLAAPPEEQARAAAIYRRAAEGYRVLCDKQKRADYDAGLAEGKTRYALGARVRTSAPPQQPRSHSTPASPAPIKDAARPFVAQAEAAAREGKWQMAVLHMQMALRHDPKHPTLRARLAEYEQAQKRAR